MSILPSEQESNLILEYILLPVVLTVFERDMIAVEQSSIKLKGPYLNLMQHSMNKVSRDLAKIRTELRKTNIKVYGEFWYWSGRWESNLISLPMIHQYF